MRRFGDRAPDRSRTAQAFVWLSRGLYEALEDFVRDAGPATRAAHRCLRIPLRAVPRGPEGGRSIAASTSRSSTTPARNPRARPNAAAVADSGLEDVCTERTRPASYISHNKFIVKLEDGQAKSVWTGGTNFSEGGIYGHSNVAHVVEDEAIAAKFLEYWDELADDPEMKPLRAEVETISPLPANPPPEGTSVIFSPRRNLDALNWYAELAMSATDGLFMTFAFGMNDIFKNVYRNSSAPFRLALLEKKTAPMKAGPKGMKRRRKSKRCGTCRRTCSRSANSSAPTSSTAG